VTDEDLVEAGKRAAAEGLRLWHLNVRDPSVADLAAHKPEALRCRDVIDGMLTRTNWRGFTPYAGNHHGPEWCGVTADDCWIEAGLNPVHNASWFGSTHRLYAWAHYLKNPVDLRPNPAPPLGVQRRLAAKLGPTSTVADLPFAIRVGDIIVIGRPTDDPRLRVVGRHILVATGVDLERGIVHTVSGNGVGTGPDGETGREGVVVADVHIGPGGHNGDHVMWVYRPAPIDLSPST
jgi:hypothetical protein